LIYVNDDDDDDDDVNNNIPFYYYILYIYINNKDAMVTSLYVMRIQKRRLSYWDGKQSAIWMICALTSGSGNQTIRMVLVHPSKCVCIFLFNPNIDRSHEKKSKVQQALERSRSYN